MVNGEPAIITAPDEHTVVFTFAGPNALFLQRLASPGGENVTMVPAEYAKQCHIAHNDRAAGEAQQEGFASWADRFQSKVYGWNAHIDHPELPTLTAWRTVTPPGLRLVLERNPYYWKVDPEGNQLPYLDRVVYPLIDDRQTLLLQVMNGEIDYDHRHVGTPENKAVLFDGMERGDYHLFDLVPASMNDTIIYLNLTHRDPVKREIFSNKLFRQALSVAINRDEIIELIFIGQGEPWQAAPRAESAYYHEELAKQFTQYDPERAEAWLDEAGYLRGPDGWRQGPDGQPIVFAVETLSGEFALWGDILELVVQHWQDIGVNAQVRAIERSFFYTRKANNDHDAVVWNSAGGLTDAILEPRNYLPFSHESNFAIPWAYWYTEPGNALAEEPPAATRRQLERYDQIKATPDPEEQTRLFMEILDIARDEFYAIGTVLPFANFGIMSNNLRNVPEDMFRSWTWPTPGPAHPEQFFKH